MVKEKPIICIKCKRLIHTDDNYFFYEEFDNGKSVGIYYIHKQCMGEHVKQNKDLEMQGELLKMISGLRNQLTEMGVLPHEQVTISC